MVPTNVYKNIKIGFSRHKFFYNGISYISILIVFFLIFFKNTFSSRYIFIQNYMTLNEDAAQLLNSLSLVLQNNYDIKILMETNYSPLIDFIIYIYHLSIYNFDINTTDKIIIGLTLIIIIPILIINMLVIKYIDFKSTEYFSKILLIFVLNYILTPIIFLGHFNFLYALMFVVLAMTFWGKYIIQILFLGLAVLSWYPLGIILPINYALMIMTKKYKELRIQKIIFVTLLNIILILFIYIYLNYTISQAEWNFDLVREEGGGFNVDKLTLLVCLISFIIFYNNFRNLKDNSFGLIPLSLLVTFILYKVFNNVYVASDNIYALNKLEYFMFLTIFFSLIFYNNLQKIFNKKLFYFIISILFLFDPKLNNVNIQMYSFSDIPLRVDLNQYTFLEIQNLLDNGNTSLIDTFYLTSEYDKNSPINAYLTSRWLSSFLGQDDRKIGGQMGWRFLQLNRINKEEFFKSKKLTHQFKFITKNGTRAVSEQEISKYF